MEISMKSSDGNGCESNNKSITYEERQHAANVRELCHYGRNLQSLWDVPCLPLYVNLVTLNLHANQITSIENLGGVSRTLKHLNLSSNQITVLEGLDSLTNLITLNMSSNKLRRMEGLNGLRRLEHLNVSFNYIESLSGLMEMHGLDYSLSYLDLRGNRIAKSTEFRYLGGLEELREIVISLEGKHNPVCRSDNSYKAKIFEACPSLLVLDKLDCHGYKINTSTGSGTALAIAEGLIEHDINRTKDQCRDIVAENHYSSRTSRSARHELRENRHTVNSCDAAGGRSGGQGIPTPRIDQALETFRKLQDMRDGTGAVNETGRTAVLGGVSRRGENLHTVAIGDENFDRMEQQIVSDQRLARIEEQLTGLLKSTAVSCSTATGDVSTTPNKKMSKVLLGQRPSWNPDTFMGESKPRNKKQSKIPTSVTPQMTNVASQTQMDNGDGRSDNGNEITTTFSDDDLVEKTYKTPHQSIKKSPAAHLSLKLRRETETLKRDIKKRDSRVSELKKHVLAAENRATVAETQLSNVFEAAERVPNLEAELVETRAKVIAEVERRSEVQQALGTLERTINAINNALFERESELREAKDNITRLMTEKEHEVKRRQQETDNSRKIVTDAESQVVAAIREADVHRDSVKAAKGTVAQLQELLAARESEHKVEMKARAEAHALEIQQLASAESIQAKEARENAIRSTKDQLVASEQRYSALEEEFRSALLTESHRFNDIQAAFDSIAQESADNKYNLRLTTQRELRATAIVKELTELIKCQKNKMLELAQGRRGAEIARDSLVADRERQQKGDTIREQEMESMAKRINELHAEVSAKDALLATLHKEKELWSSELVAQGAKLAYDNGQVRSDLESVQGRVKILEERLSEAAEATKVKNAMLDDHVETIRSLRSQLADIRKQLDAANAESARNEKEARRVSSLETAATQQTIRELERALASSEKATLEKEDAENRVSRRDRTIADMHARIEKESERSNFVAKELSTMREQFAAQLEEVRITERNNANKEIDVLQRELSESRASLGLKTNQLEESLKQLSSKHALVMELRSSLKSTEDEMRSLLQEMAEEKKATEMRLTRIGSAFSNLHGEISATIKH